MWTKNDWVELRLQLNERAVVFREGEPVRALGPGKHRIDRKLEELKPIFDTDIPLFEARPEVRAVLPAEWFREVTVGAHERAVLFREGRPVQALKPGIHRHWTVDPTVHVEVFPVAQPPPNDARVLNLLASAAEKGSESGGLPRLSAAEAGPVARSLWRLRTACDPPLAGRELRSATARSDATSHAVACMSQGGPHLRVP
jgi:hypothetical protein